MDELPEISRELIEHLDLAFPDHPELDVDPEDAASAYWEWHGRRRVIFHLKALLEQQEEPQE